MKNPVYTIGHSTRTLDEFLGLLFENNIKTLIDIRSFPGSRAYPHFNKENLEGTIPAAGIEYLHMPGLGGRRKASESITPSPNIFWNHKAFRSYADYALGGAFQAALSDLKQKSQQSLCAIMCSEAVWWRCHRRIVADYLLTGGYEVLHIMARHKAVPAEMTDGARPIEGGLIIYDRISPAPKE